MPLVLKRHSHNLFAFHAVRPGICQRQMPENCNLRTGFGDLKTQALEYDRKGALGVNGRENEREDLPECGGRDTGNAGIGGPGSEACFLGYPNGDQRVRVRAGFRHGWRQTGRSSSGNQYFIEFRARYAWDYGHTFIVHGRGVGL
jgi:hypothetical protein